MRGTIVSNATHSNCNYKVAMLLKLSTCISEYVKIRGIPYVGNTNNVHNGRLTRYIGHSKRHGLILQQQSQNKLTKPPVN